MIGSFDGYLYSPLKREKSKKNKEQNKKITKWFEKFLIFSKEVSKQVDNTGTMIYPPQDQQKIYENSMEIHKLLFRGIQLLQLCITKILVDQKDKENIIRLVNVIQGMANKQKEQMNQLFKN